MSKKHFAAIAGAIFRTRNFPAFTQQVDGSTPFDQLVADIAATLAATNPRFDRERFVTACETGKGAK